MHVLLTPSWYPLSASDPGGSFFREQAIALRKSGLKVGVIAPQPLSLRLWKSKLRQQKGFITSQEEGVDTLRFVYTNCFPLLRSLRGGAFRRHGMALFKHYVSEHGSPDLVHAHSIFHGGFLAADIHRSAGIPFVITEHSTAFARRLHSAGELRAASRIARSASARIAVSPEFATLLSNSVGDHIEWQAIPNILTSRAEDWVIEEKRPTASGTVFINVSLMNPHKGLKFLLRAFAKALATEPNLQLLLVGDGSERPELADLTRSLSIEQRVRFLGKLSPTESIAAMSKADALVISSIYETFGVVAIEALALGKPVIATRCGGPESIITPESGLLVDVADVEGLATAMLSVAANRHRYQPQTLRRVCLDRYGRKAVVSKLREVYEQTIFCSGPVRNRGTLAPL